MLVSIDGSVIVAVLIGCSISFSSFQGGTFQKIARIFYTVGLDTIGLIVAFFGQLAPIFAALIHVGSGAGVHPQFRPTFPALKVRHHSVHNALVIRQERP